MKKKNKRVTITQRQYEDMVWKIFKSICPTWKGVRMKFLGMFGTPDVDIECVDILDVIKKSVNKQFYVKD